MGGEDIAGAVSLDRIRAVIRTVELDCECREKLDQALHRFEALEQRRALRDLIHDARRQSEQIAAMLDLLRELDDIRVEERDGSVFEELALLFDAIATAASTGAGDMRRFGRLHRGRGGPDVTG